jgi:hypothetical protein
MLEYTGEIVEGKLEQADVFCQKRVPYEEWQVVCTGDEEREGTPYDHVRPFRASKGGGFGVASRVGRIMMAGTVARLYIA